MGSAMDIDVVGAFASGCIPGSGLPSPIFANNHAQPHFDDSCWCASLGE
jgi:hypothetical protein